MALSDDYYQDRDHVLNLKFKSKSESESKLSICF